MSGERHSSTALDARESAAHETSADLDLWKRQADAFNRRFGVGTNVFVLAPGGQTRGRTRSSAWPSQIHGAAVVYLEHWSAPVPLSALDVWPETLLECSARKDPQEASLPFGRGRR